ncbi:glycosyl hydrolase family 28-related protein [Thalassoroseus pseudoceratinae]|uniref:glycosyl hydrolase family 28-related protein n=1 Tax=Thalassoroseus pseudoceratinae TaxID=2713176 RepID=UPI00141F6729|nr:glycosyl hydrolase family 28-related protein [Thalassoroseus pseudoceratinae]
MKSADGLTSKNNIWFLLSTALVLVLLGISPVHAARFDITDYGATAGDESDDTAAIVRTMQVCATVGGGEVFVPAGTFIVSRQGAESPILEIPSNTTLRGEGAASTLKFDPKVNQSNFWRMLGAGSQDCRNVTIRDLHLDGSNTFTFYEPGKTPEHNHGIFFYRQEGVIENVTVRDCLIENFSGDCVGLGPGCRNMTIRNVTVRNFVRQGIQMAGGNGARDYLVTGCQDLEGDVRPGGSTIHVEHARGLENVIITDNRCRKSILAGGVDGIIIRDNIISGRLVGNGNSNAIVQGNLVRGTQRGSYVVQLGFTDGLLLKDNLISSSHTESGGLYVWGASRYNPSPSQNVTVTGNVIRVPGRGVFLNGVHDALIRNNLIKNEDAKQKIVVQRAERIERELQTDE